ncbi:unnamed protein product, partial [Vitis vinifera]
MVKIIIKKINCGAMNICTLKDKFFCLIFSYLSLIWLYVTLIINSNYLEAQALVSLKGWIQPFIVFLFFKNNFEDNLSSCMKSFSSHVLLTIKYRSTKKFTPSSIGCMVIVALIIHIYISYSPLIIFNFILVNCLFSLMWMLLNVKFFYIRKVMKPKIMNRESLNIGKNHFLLHFFFFPCSNTTRHNIVLRARKRSLYSRLQLLLYQKVGIELPEIEVRYEHLTIDGEAYVGSRAFPSFFNFIFNQVENILHGLRILPTRKRKFTILRDVSGIIKPGRLTLLLGPPSSGKTTFLLALSGKLDPSLKGDTMVMA